MSAPDTNTAYVKEITADGVAIVTLDHYPVNALSAQVHNAMADVRDELQERVAAGAVKAIVLVGAGRAFCAGADIAQQGAAPPVERRSSQPLDPSNPAARYFEDLSVPCVAGIHAFALGGGLELSMSCHYRVLGAVSYRFSNVFRLVSTAFRLFTDLSLFWRSGRCSCGAPGG